MPLICLRDIKKHYGGVNGAPKVAILHGIDLDIGTGEFVAIVGASGSGKSTLMHILGCLDPPSSGQYLFNGEDIATLDSDQLAALRREAFGFVFQAYHLIPTESARENVEVPAIYAGMNETVRQVRATELLQRLGLGERLDNRPSQLSGGQQQRVSIARALINGGHIILADEPTGALDNNTGEEVMNLLSDLAAQGHTVILITHDYKVAAQAQRVIDIQDGRIVSDSQDRHEDTREHNHRRPTGDALLPRSNPSNPHAIALIWDELRDACRAAWRVLRINRARTLLTLLGIIIGVASVVVMLAVGEGAKRQVMTEMNAMGPNMLYVSSTVPDNGGPRGVITEEDIAAMAQLPDVLRVMPILRDPALVRFGDISRRYEILATNEVMPAINRWPVAQGRFYSAEENRNVAPVAVLGYGVYQQFFPQGANPLGLQVLIKDAPYEIIGVMAEKGAESGYSNHDERLYLPRRTGMVRVFPAQRNESYIQLEALSSDQVDRLEQQLKTLLLERHGRDDFRVSSNAARLQAELATRNSMTLMLVLIAAISLLVGGIGVMNVMLMTVRERVREIGIRMATGARQQDILRQFVTEAALVSLLGGAIGAALSLAIIIVLDLAEVPVAPSLSALLGAIFCAMTTGIIFGLIPARQAARLNPVDALSGE